MTAELHALRALGLSDDQLDAYEVLALDEDCDGTPASVGRRTRRRPEQVSAVLDELVGLGLVVRDAGGGSYSVGPVEAALGGLVAARREELSRAEALTRQLAARATRVLERRGPEQLVGVVHGSEQIRAVQLQLLRSATEQVRVFDRPPYVTPVATGGDQVDPEQAALMAAGLRFRTVYDLGLFDDPLRVARVRAEIGAGEEGRVMADLPLKLLIADRALAIVPLLDAGESDEPAALLVRPSVLLDSLVTLFEALWRAAAPVVLTDDDAVVGQGENPEVRRVVELLATGLTEERLARLLGISDRTVRRRLVQAREELGVATMFQAGVAAARRGWV
jgi:hypothetical protein